MVYLRSGIFYFFLIIGLGLIFIGIPFLYFTPLIKRQKIILSWVWLVRFTLKYICNEYSNLFSLDIINQHLDTTNEIDWLWLSLDNLNDINYYFLILK